MLLGGRLGQILVLASISLIALVGMVGLAIDGGYLLTVRRHMQTTADAAAVAAANVMQGSGSYQQAATDVTAINGFTNGQNGVTVTVSSPPLTGAYAALQNYVQVNVAQAVPTYFLRVIGFTTVAVGARAVAGTINGPACIYALDPSASRAIALNGNFTVTSACGVLADSDSSSAMTANGNGVVTTSSLGVVGNYLANGNVSFTPTPLIHIAPSPDPLAALQAPSVASCTQAATNKSGSYSVSGNNPIVTVPPGVYPSGISVGGNNSTVTFSAGTYGNGIAVIGNNGSVTFNPGQYQSGGGSGSAITITGNAEATFTTGNYSFCGPVSITGNNAVTFSPGLYYGGISISGNAAVTFNPGTYILAGGGLSVTGNSSLTGAGVTFYDTTGFGSYSGINLSGNEQANLSAPTSGALAGILFFQDRTIPTGSAGSSIIGNSQSTFDGALYFPTTTLTYNGNSSSSGYTILIADKLSITGNSTMVIGDNYSSLTNGSPIKSTTLYE
ncbi:MAG TPA: pilus assembly protein TadG-related protein [Candidatus Binataceae bacterium]|nr:pilus assembly protein TadG-related protein [Candidatus Binataceae bacterium]